MNFLVHRPLPHRLVVRERRPQLLVWCAAALSVVFLLHILQEGLGPRPAGTPLIGSAVGLAVSLFLTLLLSQRITTEFDLSTRTVDWTWWRLVGRRRRSASLRALRAIGLDAFYDQSGAVSYRPALLLEREIWPLGSGYVSEPSGPQQLLAEVRRFTGLPEASSREFLLHLLRLRRHREAARRLCRAEKLDLAAARKKVLALEAEAAGTDPTGA